MRVGSRNSPPPHPGSPPVFDAVLELGLVSLLTADVLWPMLFAVVIYNPDKTTVLQQSKEQ